MFHFILTTVPPVVVQQGGSAIDGTAWVLIVTTTITALTTAIVTIISAIKSLRDTLAATAASDTILTEVQNVHGEVRTMNELTVGQLAERIETRRISDVPEYMRSAQEDRHIAMAQDPTLRSSAHTDQPGNPPAAPPMTEQ